MANRTEQHRTTVRQGFFPAVFGRYIDVERGGGLIFAARRNLNITQGGGQWLLAGRSQTIQQGGGAVLVSGQTEVVNGFVLLLVTKRATLQGNARALFSIPLPAAAAPAAGFAAGALFGRLRSSRQE
jgi:hypothetical protein